MITERNIIVKREGNRLLLPTLIRKEVDVPSNFPGCTFVMCRIVSYDIEDRVLGLTLSKDLVNERDYKIAVEENSHLLTPLNINKVIFVKRPFKPVSTEIYSQPSPSFTKKENIERTFVREPPRPPVFYEPPQEIVPEKQTIEIQIKLLVKELTFLDGKVAFQHYVNQLGRRVNFQIAHPFMKKEFDSIKNYFPKVLNIDRFDINIQIEFLNRSILNTLCVSAHISQIDESIFELVEDLIIEDNIIEGSRGEIVTLEQIALNTSITTGSENIKNSDWLLSKLISANKTKHYYHLRYLSDKHSPDIFNLRLTGKPLSFIFLLNLPNGFGLIWETYSTDEATYVWKLQNLPGDELSEQIKERIERIRSLRQNNKEKYLRTKPKDFIRIKHDYSSEDMGFKRWRSQLENFLSKGTPE